MLVLIFKKKYKRLFFKKNCCTFAEKSVMKAIQRQQITVSVPSVDMDIFKIIVDKFRWKISTNSPQISKRKTAFQMSQEDIKAGRVNTYENSNELFKKLGCI